jgi:hypothetical protein
VVTLEGLAAVRKNAFAMGSLDLTYWMCAISVNQHESICGDFGPCPTVGTLEYEEWLAKARDSVTQAPFFTCDCCAPKYFNDQPDLCELNKFDDMMRVLAREQASFRHVIAIDEHFNVFMRAWCIAEIVEGSALNLSQHMVIHSEESFDEHYNHLKNLDVRSCRASRIEDKIDILSKIKDIDKFNEYVQWLIFGTDGLFHEFLDWESRLMMVSKISSRLKSPAHAGRSGSTTAGTPVGPLSTRSAGSSSSEWHLPEEV